jgi:hypothetical protein
MSARRFKAVQAYATLRSHAVKSESPMAKNRFEQVDQREPDAITLALRKTETESVATVFCPAVISGGRLSEDTISKDMPLVEGFRSAVKLANELKAPIVVLDPDAVWLPEWGTLYRAAD